MVQFFQFKFSLCTILVQFSESVNVLNVQIATFCTGYLLMTAELTFVRVYTFAAGTGKRFRLAGEEHIIGKHGNGKRSKNGEKLVEFLLENNLTLLNSMFRKKPKNKWTWMSPDGKTRNEIDYIITNKASTFSDTGIVQNLNFNTNHRMVRSCLNESGTKKNQDQKQFKGTTYKHSAKRKIQTTPQKTLWK